MASQQASPTAPTPSVADSDRRAALLAAVHTKLQDGMRGVSVNGDHQVTGIDVARAQDDLAEVIKLHITPNAGLTVTSVACCALGALGAVSQTPLSTADAAKSIVSSVLTCASLNDGLEEGTMHDRLADLANASHGEPGHAAQRWRYRDVLVASTSDASTELARRFVPSKPVPLPGLSVTDGKVTVVAGTSGSGKTDAMLTVDFSDANGDAAPDFAVYLCVDELELAKWVPQLSERQAKNGDTRDIDSAVVKHIAKHVQDKIRVQLANAYRELRSRATEEDVPIAQMKTGRVRLVIDEAGGMADFIRAVLRGCDVLVKELRKKECLNLDHGVGVDILIGGTGSANPDVPFGSKPEKYAVWDMDADAEAIDAAARSDRTLQQGFLERLPTPVRDAVKGTGEAPLLGPTERLEFLAMLKNARLGALIVQWTKLGKYEKRRLALERPTATALSRDRAQRVDAADVELFMRFAVKDAVAAFRQLNGLSSLKDDEFLEKLATALAVAAGAYDAIVDTNVCALLVTQYGILADRARRIPTNACMRSVENPSVITTRATGEMRLRVLSEAGGELLVVPDDGRGRYEVPDAYRAMYLRQLFGSMAYSGARFEQLEQLLWRQAAALAPCVTPEHSLWDLLLKVNAGYLVASGTAPAGAAAPHPGAPLLQFSKCTSPLKHAMPRRSDDEIASDASPTTTQWRGHLVHATAQYPYTGQKDLGTQLDAMKDRSDEAIREAVVTACKATTDARGAEFRWLLPGAVPGTHGRFPAGDTVVLLNAAQAPCSDVIVMDTREGRKEAIGIAAKLYPKTRFSDTTHRDELAKWGCCTASSGDGDKAEFVRKLLTASGIPPTHRRHLAFVVHDKYKVEASCNPLPGGVAVVAIPLNEASGPVPPRPPLYPLFADIDSLCEAAKRRMLFGATEQQASPGTFAISSAEYGECFAGSGRLDAT